MSRGAGLGGVPRCREAAGWLAGCVVALAGWAACASEAVSRVQHFRFDPEASFAILALPGVPTDLQLDPDEHVTGFALGDTLQWMVEELPGHVFIKPLRSDLFTAGTLVTDRRSYQLTLRSGHPRDEWMQRVSWSYPELVVLRQAPPGLPHGAERIPAPGTPASAPVAPTGAPPLAPAPTSAPPRVPAPGIDPVALDFAYQSEGEADLRPQAVFDDGRSTWIRIRAGATLPAVFAAGNDGEQLTHFAVRGDWLVLPRVAPEWVLRAGSRTCRIRHQAGSAAESRQPPAGFWR